MSLLNDGLCEDEANAPVDLRFQLSSSSGAAATHTRIVKPYPDGGWAEQSSAAPCGRGDDGLSQASGGVGNRNVASTQGGGRGDVCQRRDWTASRSGPGTPLGWQRQDDGSASGAQVERHGRQSWADARQALRQAGADTITRGVQELHVDGGGDAALRNHSTATTDGGASAKKGSTPSNWRNKRRDDDTSGSDGEGGRNFWPVGDTVALVRAKRDQDLYFAGMGHNFGGMKTREWRWEDVRQRLVKLGVQRKAVDCGKKWDNLMQQFKKVHKYQNLSGGKDYFKLASSARRSEGFSFVMDRSVFDEMEAMTKGDHTIHLKNLADTGAPEGVQMPAGTGAVGDDIGSEGGGEPVDEDQGSTKDSRFSGGSGAATRKRKNMRQQSFEVVTDVMKDHGTLMATTMDNASKRQCSMMLRQCQVLESELELQRGHYAVADAANTMMCNALLEIAKAIRDRSVVGGTSFGDRRVTSSESDRSANVASSRLRHVIMSTRGNARGTKRDTLPEDGEGQLKRGRHVPKGKRLRPEEASGSVPSRIAQGWVAAAERDDDDEYASGEEHAEGTASAVRESGRQRSSDHIASKGMTTPPPAALRVQGRDTRTEKVTIVDMVNPSDDEPLEKRRLRTATASTPGTPTLPRQPRPDDEGGSAQHVAAGAVVVARGAAGAEAAGAAGGATPGEKNPGREGDDPSSSPHRRGVMTKDLLERALLWVDDTAFWTTREGRRMYNIVHETREYFVAIASGLPARAIPRSVVMPKSSAKVARISDQSQLQQATKRATTLENVVMRILHVWVFKSGNRPRGYHLAFQYTLESFATDLARVMWCGEEWNNAVSAAVCVHTIDLGMDLPLWFVGANVDDRPDDDDMAAYQESTMICIVHAFHGAIQMGATIDQGFILYECLCRVADCLRLLLAASMWLMRMAGDDQCSHYEALYFAKLVAKPTLIASMHHAFEHRKKVLRAVNVMTERLRKANATLGEYPKYIPDWADCGISFGHDATITRSDEAKKLDWLGSAPPDDDDGNADGKKETSPGIRSDVDDSQVEVDNNLRDDGETTLPVVIVLARGVRRLVDEDMSTVDATVAIGESFISERPQDDELVKSTRPGNLICVHPEQRGSDVAHGDEARGSANPEVARAAAEDEAHMPQRLLYNAYATIWLGCKGSL
ncbi:hypothetical protein CBR_g4794 [Chara braunii]|uniref:Myb/SANT-like DNA-binding domain-containing protein n=1 Tax=Chara braunii TaxID=69332 RepID=A0A388KIV9_CHABU|nr:hypothetical protein CBR_g4794 [Chara braunii]|eukprot:GBG69966.1 hypothetical protein CBR_g4794 [Chara braunii]